MTSTEDLLIEYTQALAILAHHHAMGQPTGEVEGRFKAARVALLSVLRADAMVIAAAEAEVENYDATRGILKGMMDGSDDGSVSLEVLKREGELMGSLREVTRRRGSLIADGPKFLADRETATASQGRTLEPVRAPLVTIAKISLAAQHLLRESGNVLNIYKHGGWRVTLQKIPENLQLVKLANGLAIRVATAPPFEEETHDLTPEENGIMVPCPVCRSSMVPASKGDVYARRCTNGHQATLTQDGRGVII